MPSARCCSSPWDDTSMATPRTPSSRISASSRWRSGASGVVRSIPTGAPSILIPVVPMTPGVHPAAAKIRSIRNVVVVFPFVPVTPTISSSRAGHSWNAAATGPMAPRTEGTRTWVTYGGTCRSRSTASARAPAATASPANIVTVDASHRGRRRTAIPVARRRSDSRSLR